MEAAAARNLFFRRNCLERSLILWWLLRTRGIAAQLRIAARKEAHLPGPCPVERGGSVASEPGESHRHFLPFDGPIASLEPATP
jgi:Transglutaminase-like superfamily